MSKRRKSKKTETRELRVTVGTLFDEKVGDIYRRNGLEVQEGKNYNASTIDAFKDWKQIEPIPFQENLELVYNNKKIVNVPEICKIIEGILSTGKVGKEICSSCFDEFPSSNLSSACGRKGCRSKNIICNDCGERWYSENKLGHIVNARHCLCMFCARVPDNKTLHRWNKGGLCFKDVEKLLPEFYYAWCVHCFKVKQCGERACGPADGNGPRVSNYECEDCRIERFERIRQIQEVTNRDETKEQESQIIDEYNKVKNCPGCDHPTIRTEGCNHVKCPIKNCETHWCFECGDAFNEDIIYDYMNTKHGRIYSYENPWFSDDEDGYDSDY